MIEVTDPSPFNRASCHPFYNKPLRCQAHRRLRQHRKACAGIHPILMLAVRRPKGVSVYGYSIRLHTPDHKHRPKPIVTCWYAVFNRSAWADPCPQCTLAGVGLAVAMLVTHNSMQTTLTGIFDWDIANGLVVPKDFRVALANLSTSTQPCAFWYTLTLMFQ